MWSVPPTHRENVRMTRTTRILVIESEIRARHALRNILVSAGYEVEIADDDAAAAELHSSQPADLVIAAGPGARVFAGARMLAVPGGGAGGEAAERLRALGAQHFLPKPFRRDDLLAAVQVTLGMAPGGTAPRL